MNASVRRWGLRLLTALAYGLVVAVVALPVAAEQAVEGVRFEDRLGSLPVEVSLSHNGVSTLDTGILGKLYWDRTGTGGFGAWVRATGPPEAGSTLSSYLSPKFLQVNAQFVDDPGEVARVYGKEMRTQLTSALWRYELLAVLVGGVGLALMFRGRAPLSHTSWSPRRRRGIVALCLVIALTASGLSAQWMFRHWQGATPVAASYAMPGLEKLSFSSPQALEIARQVQPFVEKNTERIRERAVRYEAAAVESLRTALSTQAVGLVPREGERVVIAEADPQGSLVGTAVRKAMYPLLVEQLGEDAIVMRTISGDVTSNGTVAEAGFVEGEAQASRDIPTVAVKGDHDSDTTLEQLGDNGVAVPDFDPADVDGLKVVAANDPAFKTLFGGLIVNDTGVTETGLGEALREEVDEADPVIVLVHQPRSAAGFLGIDSTSDLVQGEGRETTPWDDGIPDAPPGAINVGHLHDVDGPWVVWNTDGDLVTWTVVNQLGTSGGVEENPTFDRFSTPFSAPLKTLSVQLQYVDADSGLQTGYAFLDIASDGEVTITDRIDLGLPGGQPQPLSEVVLAPAASDG